MDISEKEAAEELRKFGFKSSWGCKEGVFLSSADAFRMVKLVKSLRRCLDTEAKWVDYFEICSNMIGKSKPTETQKPDNQSGKGMYGKPPLGVSKLDLG